MYPALSVLQALGDKVEAVLWVGGRDGMEAELVQRAGLPFRAVSAAGVHGVGVRQLPRNVWQLVRGYRQARGVLWEFRPDVLFFTGGYVAIPMGLAGRRIPTVLYVPDIEPGLALKALARLADRIALTAEDSAAFFPRHRGLKVTGYPVRTELLRWDRARAREHFGLKPDAPVLLVFGGSKGARSINRALLAGLDLLLPRMQVIHISGRLDWQEVAARRDVLPPALQSRYGVFPYLHEDMGAALAAADLVVSRAGASVLGEFPVFGLPAVLVPYPYAWRYQQVNAAYLADRGAARILPDAQLETHLVPMTLALMEDAAERARMAKAMRSLARPQAAQEIAALLTEVARQEVVG